MPHSSRLRIQTQTFRFIALGIFWPLLWPATLEAQQNRADSLLNAGNRNLYNGNYEQSFKDFVELRSLATRDKDSLLLTESLIRLGELCRATQQFGLGVSFLEEAIRLATTSPSAQLMAKALDRLSAIRYEQKDMPSAIKLAFSSLELSEKLGDQKLMASCFNILGASHTALGEYHRAITFYEKARDHLLNSEDSLDLPNILNNVANNYYLLKKYDQGLPYALESYQLARAQNIRVYILEACRMLTTGYKGLGNYQKALEFSEESAFVNEELLKEYKNVERTASELRRQNEQTLRENTLLRRVNDENQRLIRLQRSFNRLIVSGLILVTALMIMLWILYRERNRSLQILKERTQLIENQKKELQHLDQLKNNLLSLISHDFRSPLVTLHAMMELIRSGMESRTELKAVSERIKSHLHQTINTLDDVIFWSRSQMQGFKLQPEEMAVHSLCEELILKFQAERIEKNITLENAVPAGTMLTVDRDVLKIILRNFISNAIKFSFPGQIIRISCQSDKGSHRISIQDFGTGISQVTLKKLLAGEHITQTGTQNEMGTGMGLILAGDLIAKLGGTLEVQSEPGKGSTFTILLKN